MVVGGERHALAFLHPGERDPVPIVLCVKTTSVCDPASASKELRRFSWNLGQDVFTKVCQTNTSFVIFGAAIEIRYLNM